MTRPGWVYRTFDADGRLLYVGCTVGIESRMSFHMRHSPWWPLHTLVTRERFNSREEAAAAEVVAIQTEHPRWNVEHRSPDHPDGSITWHGRGAAPWLQDEIRQWQEAKRRDLAARRIDPASVLGATA